MTNICPICCALMASPNDELRAALVMRELRAAGLHEWQEATTAFLLSTQAPEPIRKAQQAAAEILILVSQLGARRRVTEAPPF
jgi:hypothetical protein